MLCLTNKIIGNCIGKCVILCFFPSIRWDSGNDYIFSSLLCLVFLMYIIYWIIECSFYFRFSLDSWKIDFAWVWHLSLTGIRIDWEILWVAETWNLVVFYGSFQIREGRRVNNFGQTLEGSKIANFSDFPLWKTPP